MAHHPHGYGQHFGHYVPPPLFPMMPASSATQPPYFYPQSQAAPGPVPVPMPVPGPPANYAASQGAYNQNATRIPGLGLGGGPMATTPSFPPAAAQQWPAQGQPSQPPPTTGYQQSRTRQQPPASLPQKPPVPYQQPHNALEEGELSEGDSEDLYEPKAPTDPSQAALQNKPSHAANNVDSSNGSIDDGDGSSIYDPHDPHVTRDDGAVQARPNTLSGAEQEYPDDEWEPSYVDRDRSGSYSPYLSPREVHRKHSIAKAAPRDPKAVGRVESSKLGQQTGISPPTVSSAISQSNGTTLASAANSYNSPASTSERESRVNGSPPLRSPSEVKKKAQEAILGLWPLKVRYQDYIDEGVDTNVLRALFKDLGLDVPTPKATTPPVKATKTVQTAPTKAVTSSTTSPKPKSPPTQKTQVPTPDAKQADKKDDGNKSSGPKAAEKSAAEERKDKIARKLAAMAQKTTAAPPPAQAASTSTAASTPASAAAPTPAPAATPVAAPVSAPSPVPIAVPAPVGPVTSTAGTKPETTNTQPAASKTRAENNAILQQKLAALKKQQAQLAAEKARVTSNESTTTSSPAAVEPGPNDINRNGNSTPNAKPTSAQQTPSQHNELQGSSKDEAIPGLSFSLPQSAQGPSRSLKRPVASDFDNYTPRFEPLKRTRTDERLVIDVSDDEDVEMDMGSPTEELPPSADSTTAPGRQALGTFPPLSDGPNRRQQDSPASSSAPTPPVHGARIDLLQKRIEEAKRLIAEAEAKKAAKRATAQSSPKPSSPAPQHLADPPKANEGDTEGKRAVNTRRNRIVSYELPRVTATLKEKQDKLKSLVAEAARLELEVQASLDEEKRLKMEMDRLVDTPTAASPELEEQQQEQPRQGKYSGLEVQPPAQGPTAYPNSSRPEPNTASDSRQAPLDERSGGTKSPLSSESPSAGANGNLDTELNNDEALQAAILTDNTHAVDTQMVDVDGPSPNSNDTTVISETIAAGVSPDPGSLECHGPAQTPAVDSEKDMKQTAEIASTNADHEAGPIAESASPSSESDAESSESDVSMQQSTAELSQSDDESYEPTPAQISDANGVEKAEQNNAEVVDDVLEEPNPNHISIDGDHQEQENPSSEDAQKDASPLEDLLSYKSPLSYFRAYRFHPKYFEEVPGGLKSMTFSARIDPMREVCPHALAGETCPKGPSCEYQHFDSMVLPDAEIITQLGSADMFVGETRTKFIEGLKSVLSELKANRIKDFDRITKAIVKHRQEFLGDRTKVLALDSGAT